MDFSQFVAIPAIVAIVYGIAAIYKTAVGANASFTKWIPIICGLCGVAITVPCFYLIPGYVPVENVVDAIATGIVCGLSATGVNQITKQLSQDTSPEDGDA